MRLAAVYCISFGALSDVSVVLGMRQSIVLAGNLSKNGKVERKFKRRYFVSFTIIEKKNEKFTCLTELTHYFMLLGLISCFCSF